MNLNLSTTHTIVDRLNAINAGLIFPTDRNPILHEVPIVNQIRAPTAATEFLTAEHEASVQSAIVVRKAKRKYIMVKRKQDPVFNPFMLLDTKFAKVTGLLEDAIRVFAKCKTNCVEELSPDIELDVARKILDFWDVTADERARRIVQAIQCVNDTDISNQNFSSGLPNSTPLCVKCNRAYHGISVTMWKDRQQQLEEGRTNFDHKLVSCKRLRDGQQKNLIKVWVDRYAKQRGDYMPNFDNVVHLPDYHLRSV